MKRYSFILLIGLISCSTKDNAAELYSKGVGEYQEKKFEPAEKTFLSVIEADDDFLNAYLMLSKIYYFNRNYQKSIDLLDEIIKRNPDHTGALYWKARTLIIGINDKSDEPAALLKRILETDSSHISARLLLSLVHEQKGNHREAIHEYIIVLEEENNLINARGNLAVLYMRLGLKERAKSEIEKAVKIAEITGSELKNLNYIKSGFDKWEEK